MKLRLAIRILAMLGAVILTACSTTEEFSIQSNPNGALIMEHRTPEVKASSFKRFHGTTPTKSKLGLFGDQTFVTVEKRGYHSATERLKRDSANIISLDLDKIESA